MSCLAQNQCAGTTVVVGTLPLRGRLLSFGVVRKFQNQDVFIDCGTIAGCTQVLSEIRGFTSLILAVADEQFVLRYIGELD